MSKALTIFWGFVAISFALVANLFDNLIEMVNVLGSLFYGTILGIFIVAFFFKKVTGGGVFYAALIAEAFILVIHFAQVYELPFLGNFKVEYLWYNVIGCAIVVALSLVFKALSRK
jgi:Na+/proline symporter